MKCVACCSMSSLGVTPQRIVNRRAKVVISQSINIHNRKSVLCRASGGLGDFFKKDKSDEEAAKKALQDAFKGKKDPFALDEEREKRRRGGGGGGGGQGGGGGGGGGFGGNMDFNDWGDKFLKWLKATLKAIAAALGFFTFIGMFYFWEPLLKFSVMLVRTVLRLDARKSQVSSGPQVTPDFSSKEELGNVEEAVISQWGGNEDVGFSDQEQEE